MRTTSQAANPAFVVDPGSVVRGSGRQVDWSLVGEDRRLTPGQTVTVGVGGAAIGATSIPVTALSAALAAGTQLDFTGAGKFAKVTVAAAAGATAITVEALPQAVVAGDTATVAGSGKKFLPAGTIVKESVSGNVRKIIPRVGNGATAYGIIVSDANEDSTVEAKSGYGVYTGGKFYESLLPDAAGTPRVLDATIKSELVALSDGMSFESYTDSSAA